MDVIRFATGDATCGLLDQARQLMDEAFADFTDDDWGHALGGVHLVGVDDDQVLAHGAVVPRSLLVTGEPVEVGYLEAVAVAPDHQGQRLGSKLVAELTEVVRAEFAMGALSTGRHSFYEHLGWERWQGPTSVLLDGEPQRTLEDDDALMVLRHGPSVALDLAAEITCHPRPGDPW